MLPSDAERDDQCRTMGEETALSFFLLSWASDSHMDGVMQDTAATMVPPCNPEQQKIYVSRMVLIRSVDASQHCI